MSAGHLFFRNPVHRSEAKMCRVRHIPYQLVSVRHRFTVPNSTADTIIDVLRTSFCVRRYSPAHLRSASMCRAHHVLYRLVSVRHRFTMLDSTADTIIDVLRTSFCVRRYFPAHLRSAPMYGVTKKSVSYRTPAPAPIR